MDIVDRLKRWDEYTPGADPLFDASVAEINVPNKWSEMLKRDVIDAIAEITFLRSLAGAITPGPAAAETLAPLRHKSPDA